MNNTSQDTVQFSEWKCFLQLAKYSNDRLAIQLVSAEENIEEGLFLGEHIATSTVNLPNVEVAEDEIIIKDYAENEGMAQALEVAGYISPAIKTVQTGFTSAKIAKKTDKLKVLEDLTFNKTTKLKM